MAARSAVETVTKGLLSLEGPGAVVTIFVIRRELSAENQAVCGIIAVGGGWSVSTLLAAGQSG